MSRDSDAGRAAMICRDGPKHRRVYWSDEWLRMCQAEAEAGRVMPYRDTGESRLIGEIYEFLVGSDRKRLGEMPVRVWQYVDRTSSDGGGWVA